MEMEIQIFNAVFSLTRRLKH